MPANRLVFVWTVPPGHPRVRGQFPVPPTRHTLVVPYDATGGEVDRLALAALPTLGLDSLSEWGWEEGEQ